MEQEQSLDELIKTFSSEQLRFVAIRMYKSSDKEAAEALGIAPDTVYNWPNKQDVNEAVKLAQIDGVSVAREQLKRLASIAVEKLGKAIDKEDPALSAILAVLDRVGLPEVKRQELSGTDGSILKVEFVNDWRGAQGAD